MTHLELSWPLRHAHVIIGSFVPKVHVLPATPTLPKKQSLQNQEKKQGTFQTLFYS